MKTCKLCKKIFISKKKKQIYCSNSCSSKDNPRGKPKITGITMNCKVCDKEFHAQQNRLKKYNVKYCSRSCLAKDLLKNTRITFKKSEKPLHKYKYITVNGKKIREHRHIMQMHLGRKLEFWEHVHHINNDSLDNRIENLIVLSNSDHQKIEVKNRLYPILPS